MKWLLTSIILLSLACGSANERTYMCGACNYPEGSCAILDSAGTAICTQGKWKLVLDGQTCKNPVCAAWMPDTHKGEESWCWYTHSDC